MRRSSPRWRPGSPGARDPDAVQRDVFPRDVFPRDGIRRQDLRRQDLRRQDLRRHGLRRVAAALLKAAWGYAVFDFQDESPIQRLIALGVVSIVLAALFFWLGGRKRTLPSSGSTELEEFTNALDAALFLEGNRFESAKGARSEWLAASVRPATHSDAAYPADPGEMVNLAEDAEYQTVLNQHRQYLADWSQQEGDNFPNII